MPNTARPSADNASNRPAGRRVGRPRASGIEPSGDVREQILDAAADLFVQKGFVGTSTREIAAAAGLRQGSLIHYFPKKYDIFAALLTRMIEPALELAEELEASGLPAAVQLHRLVHADCESLASDERNVASLMLQPEAKDPSMAEFWADRDRLRATYRGLIEAAVDSGTFRTVDIELATDAVFGVVESVIVWYPGRSKADPTACADLVARTAVAGLVSDPAQLDDIVGEPGAQRS